MREGLPPLWGMVAVSVALLAGYLVWLVRKKTEPGVFISTPIAIAIAYVFISSVAIPFERETYQFRSGAAEISDLAASAEGKRVLYADSEYRNVHPKHLRLLYYLSAECLNQGESSSLPEGTGFLIGRTGSGLAMKELIGDRAIEREVEIEIDGLPLTAYFLASGRE